jgi:hypothetical protein
MSRVQLMIIILKRRMKITKEGMYNEGKLIGYIY